MATTTKPKLTASQARAYADAERRVKRAEAALRDAKKERKELAERYWPLCPLDVELDIGGYLIRATERQIGKSFAIVEYEKKGHPITPEMEPFIGGGGTYHALSVKPNDERKALGLGL